MDRARSNLSRTLLLVAGIVRERAPLLTGLCLATAVVAQYVVDKGRYLALGGGLYALAALLFLVLHHDRTLGAGFVQAAGDRRRLPWALVIIASVVGMLAFPRFSDNLLTAEGTLLWGIGLLFLAAASWAPCCCPPSCRWPSPMKCPARVGPSGLCRRL